MTIEDECLVCRLDSRDLLDYFFQFCHCFLILGDVHSVASLVRLYVHLAMFFVVYLSVFLVFPILGCLLSLPVYCVVFIFRVLGDIITANFEVAYLIANPWRKLKPHFIEYPLILEERFTITLLASTISLTPGTVSANLRMDGKSLLIHALNVDDEEALIEQIRERYERPLKEIYEC